MTAPVTRYSITLECGNIRVRRSEHGPYVTYADHLDAIAAAEARGREQAAALVMSCQFGSPWYLRGLWVSPLHLARAILNPPPDDAGKSNLFYNEGDLPPDEPTAKSGVHVQTLENAGVMFYDPPKQGD